MNTCCLCGNEITNNSITYDAIPLLEGECCHACFDALVVPQREAYEEAMNDYEAEEEARYEADELVATYHDIDMEEL